MYKVISQSELEQIPIWNVNLEKDNPELFKAILWRLGVDSESKIEIQEGLLHRNIFNKVVNCKRYVGLERTDREWLQSPHSSLEAHYLKADPSVQEDMQKLQTTASDPNPFGRLKSEQYQVIFENENLKDSKCKENRKF